MNTPEQRALARARDLATEVLAVTGPDGEGSDAYQVGRLRHALKTLLDVTDAGEGEAE